MTPKEFDAQARKAIGLNASLFVEMERSTTLIESAWPADYSYFLSHYGHGHFGYLRVIEPIQLTGPHGSTPFLACAEDEAGGYYGFRGSDRTWETEVFYWYPSEADAPEASHPSFFNLVLKAGLSPLLGHWKDTGDSQ